MIIKEFNSIEQVVASGYGFETGIGYGHGLNPKCSEGNVISIFSNFMRFNDYTYDYGYGDEIGYEDGTGGS